jgi:hypothetical protein
MSNWKSIVLSLGKLLLVALVGYGFAGYKQQVQQDNDILVLQRTVAGLQIDIRSMQDQHNIMITQQATMKQQLEDLKEMQETHMGWR